MRPALLSNLEFAIPAVGVAPILTARLPVGITTSEALLNELAERLGFPDYFGGNWNALDECLRDFEWLPPGEIVLIHQEIPRIPEQDLVCYLNVVAEAAGNWATLDDHRFRVVFPPDTRFEIARILSTKRTWEK